MSESNHTVTFQAPDIDEVALLFPAYDIHALIACGGMGAVYQATQRSLERTAAIKILPKEFSTDEEFRKGFESEAKAMAKLNHPNLISVYDFGEVDGMLYIVMEYVDGKSLYHSSHSRAVDPSDALRIVIQVCAGLHHAHTHGILHRDIKPANILLDSSINPRIGDFGLARATESQIEEGEQIYGTPGYTAPEVIEPPYTFDQRADVFSVGVMLHELLSGKLPSADPRPVSQLCQCNPRLDVVIRKATNPNPDLRHFTASDLADELEKIASGPSSTLLVGAAAPSQARGSASSKKVYTPPKYTKKDSSSSGLVIVLLLIVAAAGAAFIVLKKGGAVPHKDEVTEETDPEANKGTISVENSIPAGTPIKSSSFNVSTFLRDSRLAMTVRIRPFIEKAKNSLRDNASHLERELGILIGNNTGSVRISAENALEQMAEGWSANRHMISENLPSDLEKIEGAQELHKKLCAKQVEILQKETLGVKSQSGIYVLKLQNQIEQSRKDGDQQTIDLIQREIDRVKGEEGYFLSLFE